MTYSDGKNVGYVSSWCSLDLLRRLRDGRHGLGRAARLLAAAPALTLGLLVRVEWWQDGEGLRHGWLTRRCRCLGEVLAVIEAKEILVRDEAAWVRAGDGAT